MPSRPTVPTKGNFFDFILAAEANKSLITGFAANATTTGDDLAAWFDSKGYTVSNADCKKLVRAYQLGMELYLAYDVERVNQIVGRGY